MDRKEQQKAYREANKEKIREQRKAYREANKEKIEQRRKELYPKYSEKAKQRSKNYYNENKEKVNEQNKIWAENNIEKMKSYKNKNYHKNPTKSRKIRLCSKYKLTHEEYEILMEQAGTNCPICETLFDWENRNKGNRPCIDHCHKSNKIRGIICGKCNAAMGSFNDDISILEKAIQWLNKHE